MEGNQIRSLRRWCSTRRSGGRAVECVLGVIGRGRRGRRIWCRGSEKKREREAQGKEGGEGGTGEGKGGGRETQ